MKRLTRVRHANTLKKKLRRSRANSDAEIYPGRDKYIVCPESRSQVAVRPEVCRINHYFWAEPLLNYKGGSAFAKKHCRDCTFWKRYVPSHMRELSERNKRTYFLSSLPKHERVQKPFRNKRR